MEKILLAKSTLEGHDRGMRTVAQAARDAGMEVIIVRFDTPDEVVKAAEQEDVDIIGISASIGGHDYILSEIVNGLREKKLEHITVIAGGVIPPYDIPDLLNRGVAKVFGPGTSLDEIVTYIRKLDKAKAA